MDDAVRNAVTQSAGLTQSGSTAVLIKLSGSGEPIYSPTNSMDRLSRIAPISGPLKSQLAVIF
jgi:hypothetical protein